jgi:hypothetical protein
MRFQRALEYYASDWGPVMKKSLAILCAAMAAAVMPVSAHAATVVEGDTITCSTNTFDNSKCNGAQSSTVPVAFGGDPEFDIFAVPNFDPLLTFDFGPNGILTLKSFGLRTITSTVLTFSHSNGKVFTSITGGGTLSSRATVVNGNLRFNLAGVAFRPDQEFTFNVTSVPEPGTWLLMMLGLGAVGFAMRRRQTASVRYQFA